MSVNQATITGASVGRTSGFLDVVRKHPLVAFFAWAFGATWLMVIPIALSQRGLGLINLPDSLLLILFLLGTYVGPAPAGLFVTWALEGKAGVKAFLRRMIQWRTGLGWYLLVIIGYPLVFILPLLLTGSTSISTLMDKWPLLISAYLPLIPVGMLYPAIGEEPGWRGFALPRLQFMYGPVIGSVILGSLHALWHLPAYFIPGAINDGGFDPVVFISNSLTIVAATIIWTWLFNNAKASILFAMLVHSTSNAVSQFIPQIADKDAGAFFGFAVFGVVALALIIGTRGRLSYRPGLGLIEPVQAS